MTIRSQFSDLCHAITQHLDTDTASIEDLRAASVALRTLAMVVQEYAASEYTLLVQDLADRALLRSSELDQIIDKRLCELHSASQQLPAWAY